MCLFLADEEKRPLFVQDDVTKNRLPELTNAMKKRMQERIGCSDKEMDFWFISLALQCTRIYVKHHLDGLDEVQAKYSAHPVIGLPFGVAQRLSQHEDTRETLHQANKIAYADAAFAADAIIQQLQDMGVEVYKQYGLIVPEDAFVVSEERRVKLAEFLNVWSLSRTKIDDDIRTLFDLIICTFYYLLQKKENSSCDMDANMMLLFSNVAASYSDFFWAGNHTEYGRIQGIQNMPFDEFAQRIDSMFWDDIFIREMLLEYFYVVEQGHTGTLL